MSALPANPPPGRFQFRLGTLLAAMLWIGVACAALAMPTPFWAGTLLGLAIVSLLTSVLVAIYRTGRTRAFAVGFLVFGGGYLAFVVGFDQSLRKSDYQAAMPTTRVFSWAFIATHDQKRRSVTVLVSTAAPTAADPFASPDPFAPRTTVPSTTTRVMQVPIHNAEDFVEISHGVLAILLGFFGGIFARFLFTTRRNED